MRSTIFDKRAFPLALGVLAIFGIILAAFFHFQKSPIGTVSLERAMPELDRYVRNTSWETGYLSGVPYRKGDVLEFLFFADSKNPYAYEFDWNAFRSRFDIESVSDGSGEISPESLVGKTFRTPSRVVVRAKAKTNGTTVSDEALSPELKKLSEEILPTPSFTGELSSTGTKIGSGMLDPSALRLGEREFSSDTNNALRILGAPR